MDTNSVKGRSSFANGITTLGSRSTGFGEWKLAIDAYYWDRLDAAYEWAVALGTATGTLIWWYRLIEAEAVTRAKSHTIKIDERLSLEYVPHELHHAEGLSNDVAQAVGDVRSRFGFSEEAKVLVSVLAEETDAPWAVGRAGYMMDKYPYDKICVPFNSVHESGYFQSVIRHEYAHVMVLILSGGKATTYLHESVTMVAQDWPRTDDWKKLADGTEIWLEPHALTAAFDDQHDPSRFHGRSLAYSQTSALGYFLKSVGGERKIADLLRAFDDNSNWAELKMVVTQQTHADEALRQVYGFGEKELFAKALEWLKASGSHGVNL